mmetsp:Transcript_38830/g.64431  ORF Transcript_38830/g.64431 Transcript_38830/m.64431 type:complete len:95 (+) Transcript_38830:2236-2520(+)
MSSRCWHGDATYFAGWRISSGRSGLNLTLMAADGIVLGGLDSHHRRKVAACTDGGCRLPPRNPLLCCWTQIRPRGTANKACMPIFQVDVIFVSP